MLSSRIEICIWDLKLRWQISQRLVNDERQVTRVESKILKRFAFQLVFRIKPPTFKRTSVQFTCNFQVLSVKAYWIVKKMVYKYLLRQIHSLGLFFSVGFITVLICFVLFFFKKALWSLFMDGIKLPQGYRDTTRRYFTFYHRS